MTTKKHPTSREELEELTKDELVDLAASRSIEVTRGDGKEGDPVKADYVEALAAAAPSASARTAAKASTRNGKRLDETIPGGRYLNEAGDTVNAHGKKLGEQDEVEE